MPPIEEQEYYILSVIETPENEDFLCFVQEAEVNGVLPVTNNIKEALVSKEYLIEDEELIYIEKSKVDKLSFGTEQGRTHVQNNRTNRVKLGLKYKDGHLQRATGIGVEEDYVLVLDNEEEHKLALRFFGNHTDNFITTDLRKAGVKEPTPNLTTVYINKEKAERLATTFPDGSRVLLKTAANLKELGLAYNKNGFLSVAEEKVEEEEKEEPPKEAKRISWLGLGIKAVSLCIDIRQALEENKPKPTKNTDLTALADEIHQVNRAKGFWDKKRNIGEMLMLVTSELGEGMEALRKGKSADWIGYWDAIRKSKAPQLAFETHIKDSFEDEIADAVIRLLDMATGLNINLERQIRFKLDYNRNRDRFHGKEF